MRTDGSCPACGVCDVFRERFSYSAGNGIPARLTGLAICRSCGGQWTEIYELTLVIPTPSTGSSAPLVPPG